MTTNNQTTRRQRAGQAWDKLSDGFDDSPLSFSIAVLVLTILIALFLKVIAINIAPYLIVMGEALPKPSGTPIIGWAYDVLNLAYFHTGAFIGWALLLMGECLWMFIWADRRANRSALRESMAEQQYQEANQSNLKDRRADRYARKMQRRAVRLPFFFIAAAGWIAFVCYGIESVIQLKAYPPIKSWGAFVAGLTIGDVSPVDFGNLGRAAWGLFGTELFVAAILVVVMWIRAHQAGSRP
jgi:hypothetical protein